MVDYAVQLYENFVDAFAGETLTTYAEIDGVPVTGDIMDFDADLERLFPVKDRGIWSTCCAT